MTRAELDKVLKNHMHWIREDCTGFEDLRADLREADLYGVNLRGAILIGAILIGANLRGADLYKANLRGASLYGADLCRANLFGADLREVDLYEADLCRADLCNADLRGADLYGVNLYRANLRGADLYEANLREADLREANLYEAKNVPYIPITCPDTGSFIGWKKDGSGKLIIKLLIPEDAKRLSATGRKCRCDKAQVLAFENLDGTPSDMTETYSKNDHKFIYKVGETVMPEKPFCEDRWQECSSGIHFFINRQEAVKY